MDSKLFIFVLFVVCLFFSPKVSYSQSPLPLVWDNIHVKKTIIGTNLIEWGILPEYQIQEFLIQRSSNGRNFSVIKRMTSNDNINNYRFEDHSAADVFYRIISIDEKGRASYSKIVSVKTIFSALSVYYDGSGNVRIQKADNTTQFARILDMCGRLLKSNVINNNYSIIDVSNLPHGTYIIKINNNDAIKFFK